MKFPESSARLPTEKMSQNTTNTSTASTTNNTTTVASIPVSRLCANCKTARAKIQRAKTSARLCVDCFLHIFESEVHSTITTHRLFHRGQRVAIGASGGKDSTVLAAVLKTLNERYDYGVEFVLLSIDEGITGYRDDSLETVKRNAVQYGMQLEIVGYRELYGWTMDEVVRQIGKKGNCTVCGVFRRQALDRGAARLGVNHVVTGHNADDMAETVLMNRKCPPQPSLPLLSRTDLFPSAAWRPPETAPLHEYRHRIPEFSDIQEQAAKVRLRKRNCPLRPPPQTRLLLDGVHLLPRSLPRLRARPYKIARARPSLRYPRRRPLRRSLCKHGPRGNSRISAV